MDAKKLQEARDRLAKGLDQREDSGAERKQVFRDKYAKVYDVKALIEAMHAAQERKEAIEDTLKEANAEFDVLRLELVPTLMEDQGVEKVTYEGIGRVSLTADVYVSTNKAKAPGLFAWLKKRKLGDLIQPTINSSTLKAFVRDRMKAGKEYPKDFLNVTAFTRASITKG